MAMRLLSNGAALALTAGILLSACSGSGGDQPTATNPTSAGSTAGTSSTSTDVTTVTAVEKEYSITLSESKFSPGAYTFRVENQGSSTHDLTIKGPGVDGQASPTLQAGDSGEVSVTLQEGTYEVWCSIGGHRGLGMDETIQVG